MALLTATRVERRDFRPGGAVASRDAATASARQCVLNSIPPLRDWSRRCGDFDARTESRPGRLIFDPAVPPWSVLACAGEIIFFTGIFFTGIAVAGAGARGSSLKIPNKTGSGGGQSRLQSNGPVMNSP
jgi:hypothetical protein